MANNVLPYKLALEKQAVGDLFLDAWGVPKASLALSLFHGMFTYDVPSEYWKESINDVEQVALVNATSSNGELVMTSNGVLNDSVVLDTFRSPRYQPNRGHLFSTSLFFDNPTLAGERTVGIFTQESGLGIRLRGNGSTWTMYLMSRTTVSAVTTDTEYEVLNLPVGFDPAKGNIYDIQMQWRGVGNFKLYIGDAATGASALVLTVNNLNVVDNVTIYNPALPIAFECINQGYPVMVLQVYSSTIPSGHNRVVIGYNLEQEVLIVNDPSALGANYRMSFEYFDLLWSMWDQISGWPFPHLLWLIMPVDAADPILVADCCYTPKESLEP